MRRVACAALFLLVCPIAHAQMRCHAMASPGSISPCEKLEKFAKAVPQDDFKKVEWPAIKATPDVLRFFSQGMTQYYGLNYEEAMRNFKKAKELDPTFAMASWGIALAAGPNINLNMTDACNKLACDEIASADRLATAEGSTATTLEKRLIKALKKRYVCPPDNVSEKKANDAALEYSNAMKAIWTDNQNDKNVSTLYAESMMDLHPWDLYTDIGKPKWPETTRIVDVLKPATGNSPEAIGANHYYIHALEGSSPDPAISPFHPVDALPSANLLQTQVPASGHLVHMSSHIYLVLGKYQDSPQGPMINGYQKSVEVNIKGSNNDVNQYGDVCRGTYKMYTENDKCPQLYYGHYLSHNYFFGSDSATFLGQSKNAIAMACDTQAHVQRFLAYEPALQRYLSAPLMTMVVNRNWDAVCTETNCKGPSPFDPKFQEPKFDDCYSQGRGDSGCFTLRAIWYWARGMARTAYRLDANDDLKAMIAQIDIIKTIDGDCKTTKTARNTFGNNCAEDVLAVGKNILRARIEWANVDKEGAAAFFKLRSLEHAVEAENKLVYDEPPQWFTPAREALGGAYLQAAKDSGNTNQAAEYYFKAFLTFEEALAIHPASGRALYGRMRALQGQGSKDAQAAKEAFEKAWLTADYTMTDADLWPDPDVSTASNTVVEPSKCFCNVPKWTRRMEGGKDLLLPPADAKDVRAGDVSAGNVSVDYTLLTCPKKTTVSAAEASVTGTPPLP